MLALIYATSARYLFAYCVYLVEVLKKNIWIIAPLANKNAC